jgi:hypothetical protein
MTAIELPALRADRIVGYLAALGVLQLTSDQLGDPGATLAWPDGGRRGAVVTTSVAADVEALAASLFGVCEEMRSRAQLLPGVDGLPLRGEKSDPMNSLSFEDARGLAITHRDDLRASEWLVSMANLSAPADDGSLGRSRWWAVGPGPVTIAGTLTKALDIVADSAAIVSALTDWRRHDWVGGYLDVGADVGKERIAGTRQRDESKAAVIGATWLALMATRWFPQRAIRSDLSETVGWQIVDRRPFFRYGVWPMALDATAVRCLLDHPVVRSPDRSDRQSDRLRALEVTEVWQSVRSRSGNNNTSVTHPEQVWPQVDG